MRITTTRLQLGLILIGMIVAVLAMWHMSSNARRHRRVIRLKETYLAIERFESFYGRLPQNYCDTDHRAMTSWRVDLLPMTIAVKHDFDAMSSWMSRDNAFYRSIRHPLFCDNSPSCRVFSLCRNLTECRSDEAVSLQDLDSREVLLVDVEVITDVNWMEPTDLSIDEISESCQSTSVLVVFADGAIWDVPGDKIALLQNLQGADETRSTGKRAHVLSSFAVKLYP